MTGWGQDAFEGEGQLQARLQEVDVPLVGPRECQAALRRSGMGRRFRMHPGWICAGVLLKVAPIIILLVTPKEGRRVKMHALEMVGVL